MISESGMRPMISGREELCGEDLGKELGLLLREQRRQEAGDRDKELNIFRSGSAPPSVEGSLTSVGGLLSGESTPGLLDYRGGANGLMSEEELRSDPAYLEYYYSHVNLNPRLPPPVLSKEDWRFTQRLQAGSSSFGGIGDKRKVSRASEGGNRLPFSQQSVFNLQKENEIEMLKPADSGEWLDKGGDGLIGLLGPALGSRQKSFADIFEDDLGLGAAAPSSRNPSRPVSRNAFDDSLDTLASSDLPFSRSHHDISADSQRASGNGQNVSTVQPIGPSISHTFASVLSGAISRGGTPDPQVVARSPSPCLPPVGVRIGASDKKLNNSNISFSDFSSTNTESSDIAASFSGLNISRPNVLDENHHSLSKHQKELEDQQNFLFGLQGGQNNHEEQGYIKNYESGVLNLSSAPQSNKSPQTDPGNNSSQVNLNNSGLMSGIHAGFQRPMVSSPGSYLKVPLTSHSLGSPAGSPARYQNSDGAHSAFTSHGLGGYSLNQTMLASQIGTGNLPPLFENAAAASMLFPGLEYRSLEGFASGPNVAEMQNLNRVASQVGGTGLQIPAVDPLYLQYLRTAEYAAQVASGISDPSMDRSFPGNAYADLLGFQKAYLGTLLSSQNQYNMPFLGKSGSLNNAYYGSATYGHNMPHQGSPLTSPIRSSAFVGPGSPLRHNERNMRFSASLRNMNGGGMGPWHHDAAGIIDEGFASSLLDEFKSNKAKCFELSEIAGHVVEFSADQYGSRFIQQKLETATIEEKNIVFNEIFPQALSLMTDVFGNYVIQKFFEHGTPAQRRELADQLTGHVLTLSLQMYGCRVIQKAIEVVDLDQQIKMVSELDGNIMRCVRDQNGNHVIQKCIECIPQDAIQFIITSFYDQVVTLSTHPYGCRVIQRVLEHCDDPRTQQIVMDEIMQCVCMLAQDQYGNYVVQHVLEHGKPHERSAIIKQLAGQIVQMSQQKFASNVVEKCLIFGGPDERQLMVNEMLGSTDENEPLQAMMKDQFANYVVQKVLETCDDQQRELILSRVKVHLTALKKYTYGKHIVARVEKLVAAGERRIGMQSSQPA